MPCVQLSPSTEFSCWTSEHVFDLRTPAVGALGVCISALHTTHASSKYLRGDQSGILTVPKGRQVECGSHCQMILIYKGIKKARVQISRGRICSYAVNLVWGVKICLEKGLESQSMKCKCDRIYLDRYVCMHIHTHIWIVIFTILVWRFLYLYSSVFLNRC